MSTYQIVIFVFCWLASGFLSLILVQRGAYPFDNRVYENITNVGDVVFAIALSFTGFIAVAFYFLFFFTGVFFHVIDQISINWNKKLF